MNKKENEIVEISNLKDMLNKTKIYMQIILLIK